VELVSVEGRRLTFSVEASDDAGVVCRGTHQRAVIDVARFTDRLAARTGGRGDGQVGAAGH
jgi:fluoroacetyl-CoA thioesterase